jgi:hypothetical protein
MANRFSSRVEVYGRNIETLFQPGGDVNDESKKITREVMANAVGRAAAFSRTGAIRDSHALSTVPTGLYGTYGYVENRARHASIKHEGLTEGMTIRSRRSVDRIGRPPGKLWLKTGVGPRFRNSVSGYHEGSSQPWLYEAGRDVLLQYGVYLQRDRYVTGAL